MGMNMTVYQIVNEFNKIDEVVAITLAGSGATGRKDNYSDIDIDVITSKEIPISKREAIIKKFSDVMEINNEFWGLGDEFVLRNSTINIDIAYFDFNWLKEKLQSILEEKNASTGYTTCFWHNVIEGVIVYDKDNKFKDFKEMYDIPYPEELKRNIIDKNYPILRENLSSYYNQIEKAINRNDLVNMNNRISAFLDSYFDIIFAINEIPHPGEKRIMSIAKSKCKLLPNDFEVNIEKLFKCISEEQHMILEIINAIVDELDLVLIREKVKI